MLPPVKEALVAALVMFARVRRPANILLLDGPNGGLPRWHLVDFTTIAPSGSQIRARYTLEYVSPEFVRAVGAMRAHTIACQRSMDVWSMGVIMYELMTCEPFFPLDAGRDMVRTSALHLTSHILTETQSIPANVGEDTHLFQMTVVVPLHPPGCSTPPTPKLWNTCTKVGRRSTSRVFSPFMAQKPHLIRRDLAPCCTDMFNEEHHTCFKLSVSFPFSVSLSSLSSSSPDCFL